MNIRFARFSAIVACGVCLLSPVAASAQTSKSAPIGKDLVAEMTAKKLDAIAAKLDGDHYAAALYFPGAQIVVVSGTYASPPLMDQKLLAKQYREAYMELSGTTPRESKILVMDMGAPGLTMKKDAGLYDSWTQGDKQVSFDGNPSAQKIPDAEYAKRFSAADEEYAKILGALLAEAKK